MKPAWKCIAGLVLVSLCACTPTRVSREPLLEALHAARLGYASRWAADLNVPADQQLAWVEQVGENLFCVETPGNLITALSLRDGSVLWQRPVGDRYDELLGLLEHRGQLLAVFRSRLFFLEPDSGKVLNISTLDQAATSPPTIVGDYAVFGSVSGRVFAHDLVSGFSKWSYQLTGLIPYSPQQLSGMILVADRFGVVAAVTADSGTLIWRRHPTDGLAGRPLIAANLFLLPTVDNKLQAIQPAQGTDRWVWRAEVPLAQGPIQVGERILQKLENDQWVAIDPQTGQELWRLNGRFHSPVQIRKGLLFAADQELVLVDPSLGEIRSRLPAQKLLQLLAGPQQSLILVSPQGRLLRLDPLD